MEQRWHLADKRRSGWNAQLNRTRRCSFPSSCAIVKLKSYLTPSVQETRVLSFMSMRLGSLAMLQPTHIDFPYANWLLSPIDPLSSNFILQTQRCVWICTENPHLCHTCGIRHSSAFLPYEQRRTFSIAWPDRRILSTDISLPCASRQVGLPCYRHRLRCRNLPHCAIGPCCPPR